MLFYKYKIFTFIIGGWHSLQLSVFCPSVQWIINSHTYNGSINKHHICASSICMWVTGLWSQICWRVNWTTRQTGINSEIHFCVSYQSLMCFCCWLTWDHLSVKYPEDNTTQHSTVQHTVVHHALESQTDLTEYWSFSCSNSSTWEFSFTCTMSLKETQNGVRAQGDIVS